MSTFTPLVPLFLSLLFLFTLTHARDLQLQTSHSEPVSKPEPNKPHSHSHDTVSFTINTIDPVPLTFLRFRPINRHFHPGRPLPLDLPLSLRNAHRSCRHSHPRQIPYGNDAIVLSDAARPIHRLRWDKVHGGAAQPRFPATMERRDFDHHDLDRHDSDHHDFDRHDFDRHDFDRHDSDHEHRRHHDEHHHHRHHHHREESWFAKKIRKFLNLF